MLRVYACLTEQHDLRLVLLAGVICLFATNTAFSLYAHAEGATERGRAAWLAATAVVTGVGIWSTHFVAMLAFQPGLPIGYGALPTFMSIVIAVAVTGVGFSIAALGSKSWRAWFGGAVVGVGIFSMHFTGMSGLRIPGVLRYDPGLAIAALLIGVAFGALAMHRARGADGADGRAAAAGVLALGICGLHFTAMGAVELVPDPIVFADEDGMSGRWLAGGVAAATLLIAGIALAASIVDQRFASTAEREAARLRAVVAELETTKQKLEAAGARLKQALVEADAANHAKTHFLATMSHELRTPLNAVIGFADLLAAEISGKLDDKQKSYVGDIRGAGVHLLGLVNDILDVTKLESNAMELDEEDLDLAALAQESANLVQPRADQAGVALTVACAVDRAYLRADSRRVRQVLLNLLSNAIKFTPGGGKVALTIDATPLGSLAVAVADTGIGIAARDIPTALADFGQVDSTLARKFEGTGLGLPLSRRLMELHGGTLVLDSAPGKGTTVTVAFPPERVVNLSRAA
ncbi:MAG: MHYT domain-containing protein [Rhodospirillales bacterium]